MKHEDVHVVTCIFNPLGYKSRTRLYNKFIKHMKESGVSIHVIECATKDSKYTTKEDKDIHQMYVRSKSILWSKENLLNIILARLPPTAKYVLVADADIEYLDLDWPAKLKAALDKKPIVQAWSKCFDLGPDGKPMVVNAMGEKVHESFAYYYAKFGTVTNEMQRYAHPGYAWGFTSEALKQQGGLFEYGILGGADRYMATAWINKSNYSFNLSETSAEFIEYAYAWTENAQRVINGNIGCLDLIIKHGFHGYKNKRNYVSRKQILIVHDYNPATDLVKNADGVLEYAGNKPRMEKEIEDYFSTREEDEHLKVKA